MGVFVAQLDGSPLAGDNCGPATVAEALRWSTRHTVAPTPSAVRANMGDLSGGTHPRDLRLGWDAYAAEARRLGWDLPEMRYREHGDWSRLREILEAGDAACVAVDYSVVPRGLSGDPSFRGLHSIFVAGIRTVKGDIVARVFDPLCDGRRTGIPGPGPVFWPLPLLRKAAGLYSDAAGKATWNAVARATQTPGAGCADCLEQLVAVQAELETTRDALAAALRRLDAIVAKVGEASDILETIAELRATLGIGDPNASATRGLKRG